ncbi:hypothetical protein [Variovorax sp. Root318D1]|uniref:hypothetical protein n=1 Tax=Variovorax sp. Root318D1 TaxID=1736513 RepID=UPI001F26160D|nr:hypothetical protein [Variovorax sp. Root318D1]
MSATVRPAKASLRSSAGEGRGQARQGTHRATRWRKEVEEEEEAAGFMKRYERTGEAGRHVRGAPRAWDAERRQISEEAFFRT